MDYCMCTTHFWPALPYSVPEISEEVHVSVQPVPWPAGSDAGAAASSGSSDGGGEMAAGAAADGAPDGASQAEALVQREAPPPVYLAPGNMASWSWQ